MNSLLIIIVAAAVFALGYRYYSAFIARRVLALDPSRPTPAQSINDGVDYVPAQPAVLFGHHFASIAGLGPIVGPAIAVVWGWLPALLWVVLGTVFIGAVHDFAVLGISVRRQGRTIGDIAVEVIGPRARILFMLIILFAIALAMGVFVIVIGDLFTFFGTVVPNVPPTVIEPAEGQVGWAYPQAVLPSIGLIFVAAIIGYLTYAKKLPFGPTIAAGAAVMFGLLFLGIFFPLTVPSKDFWIMLLLVYAYIASVLPVWLLLRPRDFLSSFNLYAMLALLVLGFIWFHPEVVAPAVNLPLINNPAAALPPMFPMLFITIACGAVSGFHCMVSSGTSSKQLANERDARVVGYGGMVTEGFLAVLVIMACTAGYLTLADWNGLYKGWLSGVGVNIGAFVNGAATITDSLGIPHVFGRTFFSVTIVAFALTTLDTGARLIRYTLEELFKVLRLPAALGNRYISSFLAAASIGFFALLKIGDRPAGLALWQLFGSTNQLLAGVALLVATIYFFKQRRPSWPTFLPMVFMLVITAWAMSLSLYGWLNDDIAFQDDAPLIVVGAIILVLLVWLVLEAVANFRSFSRDRRLAEPRVILES